MTVIATEVRILLEMELPDAEITCGCQEYYFGLSLNYNNETIEADYCLYIGKLTFNLKSFIMIILVRRDKIYSNRRYI